MAIRQSEAAKRRTAPNGYAAGLVVFAKFDILFTAQGYTTGTDKIEFGILPAGAQPIRIRILPEGVGTPNITLGLLSGEPGVADDLRTLGTEFLNAVALVNNTDTNVTTINLMNLAPSQVHRSIGATLSANVTAGAGKKISAIVEYVF